MEKFKNKPGLKFFFSVVFFIFFCSTASGQIIYVDSGAPGGDGTSWPGAFNHLQKAIDAAGVDDEIWVRAGVYTPGTTRYSSFHMKNRVAIYGGFAGGETSRSGRDPMANETVLSGEIGAAGDNQDNCYHVFSHVGSGLDKTAVLDGFSITGGNADGDFPNDFGGGMINAVNFSGGTAPSSPNIRQCVFKENSAKTAGGAVANYGVGTNVVEPVFDACLFLQNTSSGGGGGIANLNASAAVISGTGFENNQAILGAAIYNSFFNNHSPNPEISDCRFLKNNANELGGAIFSYKANLSVSGCVFNANSAINGGAVYNSDESVSVITNSTFSCNNADNLGGGLYNTENLSIVNCSLSANNAKINGGGIHNTGSALIIKNSVFWMNLIDGKSIVNASEGVDCEINNLGTIISSYSDIRRPDTTVYNGVNNYNTDPNFFRNPDFAGNDYGDLHIRTASANPNPCIDNGTPYEAPSIDFDGENRVGNPDIGADEFIDSDNDGMPDYWEIAYGLDFMSQYGEDGAHGDIDNDGIENINEYLNGYNPGENHKPVAVIDVKPSDVVAGKTSVTLESKSYDVDDSVNTWLWESIGVTNVALRDANSETAFFEAPELAKDQVIVLEFRLSVSSGAPGYEKTGTTECKVIVKKLNSPPLLTVGDWVGYYDKGNAYVAVKVNSTLTGKAKAIDVDAGDVLRFSASGMPEAVVIDPVTGDFSIPVTRVGTYYARFHVTDNGNPPLGDSKRIAIVVTEDGSGNIPPVLDPVPPQCVDLNATLSFIVTASDGNSDPSDFLSFSASNLPTGAEFNPETGRFSWVSANPAGHYSVLFTVDDGRGGSDFQWVTITVGDINQPPVLTPIGPKQVIAGEQLTFIVSATDPDDPSGAGLKFSASNLPKGAGFNPETQVFSWHTKAGTDSDYDVIFKVEDRGEPAGSDYEIVTITVGPAPIDHPPVLQPVGNKSVIVNETLMFTINANDSDGDFLTYSAACPSGANFNSATRVFSWQPYSSGNYTAIFTVTANGKNDSERVTISVDEPGAPTNRPPVLDPIGDKTVVEGLTISFSITASDPDGDDLLFRAPVLPEGRFDPETRSFSWTPSSRDAGDYFFKFEVWDGRVNVAEEIKISVYGNAEPEITPVGDKKITEGSTLSFYISASDADGDSLSYSMTGLPGSAAASINPQTGYFSWTPDYSESGEYNLLFSVFDGAETVYENVKIIVENLNRPPSILTIGEEGVKDGSIFDFALTEGVLFELSCTASDPDDDELNFSCVLSGANDFSELPETAAINEETGEFSWRPEYGTEGTFELKLIVSDGELSHSVEINLNITDSAAGSYGESGGSGGSGSGCFIEMMNL